MNFIFPRFENGCTENSTQKLLTKYSTEENNKHVICWPRSVHIGKNCALGLEYGPRPHTQDLWHSFSQYGPPCRQINVCYLPGGRSVWGKNCARGLQAAGRGPYLRPRAQFFPVRTDLARYKTCLFFFCSKLALQITLNGFVYAALVIQWACAPSTNDL